VATRGLALALAAIAGGAVWLSLGVLAVVQAETHARIGALPPWWVLGVCVSAACGVAWKTRLSLTNAWPLSLALLIWLPWLPGRVPTAFLIWQGPIVWPVWIAIGVGLLLARSRSWSVPTLLTDPARAPWAAAALAALGSAIGAAVLAHQIPAGDEPHYLAITQSLLQDGDLRIENNHRQGDYFAYYHSGLAPDFLQRGQDGQIYSVHAPGVSVLVLPGFAIAGYRGALITVILLWSLGLALVWRTAWRLTGRADAAWMACAAVTLTAPGYFHSFTIYPDGVGAVCTAAGLWLLVELEAQTDVSTRTLTALGAVLAIMPWLHTRFSLLAGAFGAAFVLRLVTQPHRAVRLAYFLSVPVASGLLWLTYFWWIWGEANPAAPYGHYTQSAIRQTWPGVPGLIADQQFGLVSNAPIYATAAVGWLTLMRSHPRLAIEIALLTIPYAAAVGAYRMWWAGFSAPARFLIAILPAAALPIAWLWASRALAGRLIMLALAVLSGAIVVARLSVEGGALLYNGRDGFDLLLDWANRAVNLPLAFPSLHRDVVPNALVDIGAWIAAGALWCALATLAIRRTASNGAAAWALVAWTMAASAMLAATITWSRHADRRLTPNTSALAWLQQWSPAWQTLGVQTRPLRVLSAHDLPTRLTLASGVRGPRQTGALPLFSAPLVPAGEYEVVVEGSARRDGAIAIEAGRVRQELDRMNLAGRSAGLTGLTVRLPVRAHSLTIRGDAAAAATVSRLTLRPRTIVPRGDRLAPGYARRASRYGRARAFFLDDDAFVEPSGFWTRGSADTALIVDADADAVAGGLPFRVRAGAVATPVTLSSGAWSLSLSLSPGETRELTLPALQPGEDAWAVTIATGEGFRPGLLDPKNQDLRHLGVWIEF
jgi:hypothetical protein